MMYTLYMLLILYNNNLFIKYCRTLQNQAYTHKHAYTHAYTRIHTQTRIQTHAYTHKHEYKHTHTHNHTSYNVRVRLCTYIYIHTYVVHIYVNIMWIPLMILYNLWNKSAYVIYDYSFAWIVIYRIIDNFLSLQTIRRTVYFVYYILYDVEPYIVRRTLYIVRRTIYIVRRTLYAQCSERKR